MRRMQTNSFLLAAAGILQATYAALNCFAPSASGSFGLRQYLSIGTALILCKIALAAGVCLLLASLWKTPRSYFLALHGIALAAFGALGVFVISPHLKMSFLPFAMLLALSALSFGLYAFAGAFSKPLKIASWASLAFALSFLVVGLRLVRLEPRTFLLWMSSYFLFNAVCLMELSYLWKRLGPTTGPPELPSVTLAANP